MQPVPGLPNVLVLTPVKDAADFLPRYFELLEGLDYPRARMSLGFLVGNSTDDSWGAIASRLPALEARYRRVGLFRKDYPATFAGPRAQPEVQLRRRSTIARARNHLLSQSLRDEEWVLWLDADLAHYPPDLIQGLLGGGGDVVAANCLCEHSDRCFDLNTFVDTSGAPLRRVWLRWRHTRHGLYQPPARVGRTYLTDFRGQAAVPVDGVGGTVLMVRADLHRDGLVFPPFAFEGFIETEGLALMAQKMGASCRGLPDLIVRHRDR